MTLAAVVEDLPPWSALLARGRNKVDLQQALIEQRRSSLQRLAPKLGEGLEVRIEVLVGSGSASRVTPEFVRRRRVAHRLALRPQRRGMSTV